jgi:hypothetical protein
MKRNKKKMLLQKPKFSAKLLYLVEKKRAINLTISNYTYESLDGDFFKTNKSTQGVWNLR